MTSSPITSWQIDGETVETVMQRSDSVEKTLRLGKVKAGGEGDDRGRTGRLDGISGSTDMSLSKLWEMVKDGRQVCCSPWGHRVRHD